MGGLTAQRAEAPAIVTRMGKTACRLGSLTANRARAEATSSPTLAAIGSVGKFVETRQVQFRHLRICAATRKRKRPSRPAAKGYGDFLC